MEMAISFLALGSREVGFCFTSFIQKGRDRQ